MITGDELRQHYYQQREAMRHIFNRDLPYDEICFDRWERAESLGFGEKSSIYHNSYVYGSPKVGENTWIGPFTILDATGGLTIGDNCSISAGVHIYTHDTVARALSGGVAPVDRAPVAIGNDVYIGPNSVVSKGVTIGDGAVIGALSFVNRDIPAGAKAYGTPARPFEARSR